MKLLIAIPALNEELSIAAIIERSLAAIPAICAKSNVTEVQITVVSDGSTDRTVEIAQGYAGRIHLIVLPENRGYGAAILEAWKDSDADLLGFLDADGSCDPVAFGELCQALRESQADIAVGCRMHRQSKMPAVRRIGNHIFANMLSLFASRRLHDVASGMRVVRRTSLIKIMPLPTGLHFTPAMSARAALSPDLSVVERNVPYHERVGRSKLRIWRDGMRFARAIFEMALLYRPSRPLGVLAWLLVLAAAGMMITPVLHYAAHRRVEDWMLYRFVVSQLAGMGAVLLFCTGYLGRKVALLALSRDPRTLRYPGLMGKLFASRAFWLLPLTLTLVGAALVFHAFIGFIETGKVYEHWSRFVAMTSLVSVAMILTTVKLLDHSLNLIADRLAYLRGLADELLRREPQRVVPAWLQVIGSTHGTLAHTRRVKVLAAQVAKLIPAHASVADVGCGDGQISWRITQLRPDVRIEGYEIAPREITPVRVHNYDGLHLPLADKSVDAVLLIDVLHHTPDPAAMLREAVRVARQTLIIKDHRMSRPDAYLALRFMDWVGNRPHGVTLPYNYWSEPKWQATWKDMALKVEHYQTNLGLYAPPASWVFEPGLHFLACLRLDHSA